MVFSDSFLDAVIDGLLPGESGEARESLLPPASAAGLAGRGYAGRHADILAAVARRASGEEHFLGLTAAARHDVLAAVEREASGAFRALVQDVVTDYHDQPAVLAAYGWRLAPPQPAGHHLEPPGDDMPQLLARVRARGDLWRAAP
jgi:hypothetical protein